MSEMLERVALAFREQTKVEDWEELKALARIAITAMRDFPPKQFVNLLVKEEDEDVGAGSSFTRGEVLAVWQAMLDEALKDDA